MMPLIWVALALFLLSIWLRDDVARRRSAAAGWGAFAGYWAWQVGVYARLLDVTPTSEVDPSNTVLSAFVVGLCLLFARHILTKPGDILLRVTRVTALVGILYFPFAEFPLLHGAIIGGTAHITVSVLLLLGTPARVASPEIIVGVANPFVIGPTKVEIILACTAIESIALFAGVIFGMKAPRRRQMLAFAIVIPGIYLLNLVRNLYVILAYAY
ncbi:MAG: archaeosortase A, partial [Euryarchaeota archaeon]|nr:archaeosortase A [Euryarchaeota archaeon]